MVERYRQFFKPERLRVALLAESHVFTSDEDRKIVIPSLADLPGYPTQYARFVYCLGYGERMFTNEPQHPKRDGTPQFWKILFSCANRIIAPADFKPVLAQTPYPERLQNKTRLLQQLKDRGVWLIDASIVALYKQGKKVPNMLSVVQSSWNSYTRDVVVSSNPQHVICIGKGVARVVEGDLQKFFRNRYTVIAQPNARLSSEQHMANYQRYRAICLT